MHLPSAGVLAILVSTLAPTALAANAIFPWADDTNRPECKSCLDKLVSDTCGGASDSGFEKCLCDGKGAAQLNDECFPECCSASTVCTGQGPYKEWWLQCVDDYPKLCADPPSAIGINRDLEEHCTREDIEEAEKTKAEEEGDEEEEKDASEDASEDDDDDWVNGLDDFNRDSTDSDSGESDDGNGEGNASSMYGAAMGNVFVMAMVVAGMHVY